MTKQRKALESINNIFKEIKNDKKLTAILREAGHEIKDGLKAGAEKVIQLGQEKFNELISQCEFVDESDKISKIVDRYSEFYKYTLYQQELLSEYADKLNEQLIKQQVELEALQNDTAHIFEIIKENFLLEVADLNLSCKDIVELGMNSELIELLCSESSL